MTYEYEALKPRLFTEDGQRLFLEIRDRAKDLRDQSGAAQMGQLIGGSTGDTWDMLACVHRMVELGELLPVRNPHSRAGQHEIFIRPYRD